MDHATVQVLLRQFSAPLAAYAATSLERKEVAEMLVRSLWAAMIAGPEMEEETWKSFRAIGKLDAEAIQIIQGLYFNQMKPVVNDEQLADLRRRYQHKRREQA